MQQYDIKPPDFLNLQEREKWVNDYVRTLYETEKFTGTIEDRLEEEHLYYLCKENLTLNPIIRDATRPVNTQAQIVATGKQGVLAFVNAGKREGKTEEEISKNIWIQMKIFGVSCTVNIKNVAPKKKEIIENESEQKEAEQQI